MRLSIHEEFLIFDELAALLQHRIMLRLPFKFLTPLYLSLGEYFDTTGSERPGGLRHAINSYPGILIVLSRL